MKSLIALIRHYIPQFEWKHAFIIISFSICAIALHEWGKSSFFIKSILVPIRCGALASLELTVHSLLDIPVIGWISAVFVFPVYGIEWILYQLSLVVPVQEFQLNSQTQYILLSENRHINFISFLYWFAMTFFWFFVVPALSIKWILKEKLADYGFIFRGKREHLIVVILYLAFLIVLIPVSRMETFYTLYPLSDAIKFNSSEEISVELFILYELGFLMYWIGWEFGLRGYLIFGFLKKFGDSAILFSIIPFVVLKFGKPPIEVLSAIIAGLILGAIAIRARSIMPCILIHFLVAFTMDILANFWRIQGALP